MGFVMSAASQDMKLSIETLLAAQHPTLDLFEGYLICLHRRVAGVLGFMLLGHMQELWVPLHLLTLAQVRGLLRLERDRRKRYPLVIVKRR